MDQKSLQKVRNATPCGWGALPGNCPGLRALLQRCLKTVPATPDSSMEPL